MQHLLKFCMYFILTSAVTSDPRLCKCFNVNGFQNFCPSFDAKPQCWSVDSRSTCRMTPRRLHFVKKKKTEPFCLTANVQI